MESFFHTLKTERVHHRLYATRDQARRDLFQYIEGFYNPRRLHSALGYISPAEAERRAAQPRPLFRGRIRRALSSPFCGSRAAGKSAH
jgi:transposase InsO family protein